MALIDDSSIDQGRWYRAPGWPAAARQTKTIPTVIRHDRWYTRFFFEKKNQKTFYRLTPSSGEGLPQR